MISLLLSIMLCMTSCKAPVSDSFVEAYKMYEKKHYNRFHRLARRHTIGHPIKKKDSLIFLSFLTISTEVRNEWDWNADTRFNNAKFASWEYLDYKRLPDKFLVYADNKCVKLYSNGAIGRKKRRYHSISKSASENLMEMVSQYKPDCVFRVSYVPGWFFIIGEDIVYIKPVDQGLIYREDALEVLKHSFAEPDYWPVFTGQER